MPFWKADGMQYALLCNLMVHSTKFYRTIFEGQSRNCPSKRPKWPTVQWPPGSAQKKYFGQALYAYF